MAIVLQNNNFELYFENSFINYGLVKNKLNISVTGRIIC